MYNEYRYAGMYREPNLDLYQMGARYYDEDTGRFTQQDPLLSTVFTRNRYHFTQGNPVNYVDPNGLDCYGITGGGSLYGGVPDASFGGTASAGAGLCDNPGPGGPGPYLMAYGSRGGFIDTPGDDNRERALGAYAGVGGGIFWTNADYPSDLSGSARQVSVDTPIFSIGLSFNGSGTFTFSLTGAPPSTREVLGISVMDTETAVWHEGP
jgi:RHS repeat-associated protein